MAQGQGLFSIPPPAPRSGSLVLSYLSDLRRWLMRNNTIAGAGLTSVQTESGRVLSIYNKSLKPEPEDHPFTVIRSDTNDGATKRVTVRPGTISGVCPSNIFSPLTIAGTGTEYVILNCEVADDAVSTCTLSISPTHPSPSETTENAPPATFQDLIAVIHDGVVFNIRKTNLIALSTEVFRIADPAPVAGGFNQIIYYRWDVGIVV